MSRIFFKSISASRNETWYLILIYFQNEPVFEIKYQKENAHSQDVNSIAWNPVEDNLIASSSDDGSVKLWRLEKDTDDTI